MPQAFSSNTAAASPGMRQDRQRLDWSHQPARVAAALAHQEGFVWLDTARAGAAATSILTASPAETFRGHIDRDWAQVTAALESGARQSPGGGLFGWVAFDGKFVLGSYPHVLVYDHASCEWFDSGAVSTLCDWSLPSETALSPALDFQPLVSRADFLTQVRRAQEFIAAGDIYQVNLSVPWRADWPAGQPFLPLYQNLRAVSPAPHAACLNLDGTSVLSASPELFLNLSGRAITTRPIKGTRPRFAGDSVRDADSARELLASPKERAELLMITDLERNDLGQVCEFGSVHVPSLWQVQDFAQVYHLVSTVTGTLRQGVSHADAFRACFPGGSISGAPKKRALEIIAELEPYPRGLYTGAIGYFGFGGESQWNIAIRTAVRQEREITFHVGAGIVSDSVPEHEWEETLHKAAGMLAAARPPPK